MGLITKNMSQSIIEQCPNQYQSQVAVKRMVEDMGQRNFCFKDAFESVSTISP